MSKFIVASGVVGVWCTGLRVRKAQCETWNENWDRRHVAAAGAAVPTATHQLVLIRHGQYQQLPGGDHVHSLTELGHKQARLTGSRLSDLIAHHRIYPIQRVYYSTMKRATETWFDIKSELKDEMLPQDYDQRPCSMIREAAVCRPDPPSLQWKVEEIDFIVDHPRAEAAFWKYVHRAPPQQLENYSTVLVCHGNIIRYLVMKALQLPEHAWLRTAAFNASITILEISPNGRVSLRCFGEVGHLSPDMITYN